MKIAFVSATFPQPVDNGKKVVLRGFMQYLCDAVGPENVTYIKIGAVQPYLHLAAYKVLEVPVAAPLNRVVNASWNAFIKRSKSLQEALLYSRSIEQKLGQLIDAGDFDVVILDTVRVGQFFTRQMAVKNKRRWVLYLEDLFSRRYDSILTAISNGMDIDDPLGAFSAFVPTMLHPLIRQRVIYENLFRFERSAIRKSEQNQSALAASVCLVSPEETRILAEQLPASPIWETPPCLPLPCAEKRPSYWNVPEFVFIGALNYAPNAIALRNFINVCMPIIAKTIPNARIRIIGRNCPDDLKNSLQRWPHFSIEGFVEDLGKLLNSATAMLVPIEAGGGIKLKVLEAISYGLPVITTPNGIEATKLENGIHCLVAQSLADIPNHMKAISDPTTNRRISDSAKAYFIENYVRDAVYPIYDKALLGLNLS